MTSSVLSAVHFAGEALVSSVTAIQGAGYAVSRGVRFARVASWTAAWGAWQTLTPLVIPLALAFLLPLYNAVHNTVGKGAKFFASWKDNRYAAVNAASSVKPPFVRVYVVTPLLIFVFGFVYLVAALFHAIWKNIFFLIVSFTLIAFFTWIEVYSGYIVTYTQQHLNLLSSTVNTAGSYTGMAGDTFNIFLPAFNAQWQNTLTTGQTIVSWVQGQAGSGGSSLHEFSIGRRLAAPSLTGIAAAVGPAVRTSAALTVAIHRIELIILAFGLEIVLPLLPYILPVLDFIVQRVGCFLLGMAGLCNVREVANVRGADSLLCSGDVRAPRVLPLSSRSDPRRPSSADTPTTSSPSSTTSARASPPWTLRARPPTSRAAPSARSLAPSPPSAPATCWTSATTACT